MSKVRYSRNLSPAFEKHLSDSGVLSFLIRDTLSWNRSDHFAFDLQVREGDVLTLYYGTTKLVDVRFDPKKDQVRLSASRSYSHVAGYQDLMKRRALHELASIQRRHKVLSRYLLAAAEQANERYYRNKKEGFWQNRVSLAFGRMSQGDADWLVIDREAEIGFPSEAARKAFQGPIQNKYESVRKQILSSRSRKWGDAGGKAFGNQCDFLAIGRKGELFCIELKHGDDAPKVTFGSLQVAVYRDLFTKALPAISEDIKALVRQKVAVGLLPEEARSRLPKADFKTVVPVLAVAVPNHRSACWDRLGEVMEHCPEARVTVVEIDDEKNPVCISRS